MIICKDMCKTIQTRVLSPSYDMGLKYCKVCSIYLYHDGLRCPCCHHKLRTSPRYRKD